VIIVSSKGKEANAVPRIGDAVCVGKFEMKTEEGQPDLASWQVEVAEPAGAKAPRLLCSFVTGNH
jgi:hypothetical protein